MAKKKQKKERDMFDSIMDVTKATVAGELGASIMYGLPSVPNAPALNSAKQFAGGALEL